MTPERIIEDMGNLLSSVTDAIRETLLEIFVADPEYIQQRMGEFTEFLQLKFGIDTSSFEHLFENEQVIDDVYMDYNISGVGSFNLKVFDTGFFKDGVNYFRPFIRGFLVLMILFFHVKQVIGFFGYDAGVVAGRSEHIKSAREAQKE